MVAYCNCRPLEASPLPSASAKTAMFETTTLKLCEECKKLRYERLASLDDYLPRIDEKTNAVLTINLTNEKKACV
jgi:hypothetical protein